MKGKYKTVLDMINEDRQVWINNISNVLGFSRTKTRNYIKNNLGIKKVDGKWSI